ncbi:hypothetical protein BpHYR1_054363 [Brachionus plicatilis]|uniref:Uncharacterized protein n=1 Tax=Brachionus plicatilis TaxID=10195 RepID=A0A3M7RES3_BRAPC|nr:hypothetical protein BpHYR1_054363 [Brachionus plicatilis]
MEVKKVQRIKSHQASIYEIVVKNKEEIYSSFPINPKIKENTIIKIRNLLHTALQRSKKLLSRNQLNHLQNRGTICWAIIKNGKHNHGNLMLFKTNTLLDISRQIMFLLNFSIFTFETSQSPDLHLTCDFYTTLMGSIQKNVEIIKTKKRRNSAFFKNYYFTIKNDRFSDKT